MCYIFVLKIFSRRNFILSLKLSFSKLLEPVSRTSQKTEIFAGFFYPYYYVDFCQNYFTAKRQTRMDTNIDANQKPLMI